jgi:fructoselysine-6-P-deglycase FrlB-like protein
VNSRTATLSTVVDQLERQPATLASFLREPLPEAPPNSLFVGVGDSYVASSIASYFSSMECQALDPYELISSRGIMKGKTTYFVTVSGDTSSNVTAARIAEGVAKRTTAITANAKGKIIGTVDEVIFIPCEYIPKLPGTLSFSLSLLALLKLACGQFKCDLTSVNSRAKRDAKKLLFSDRGATYFLGNSATFPVCRYSALKMYEFLGARAQADMLEEFNHAPLFSLRKHDVVNIFCALDPLRIGEKLATNLRSGGFTASGIPPFGLNAFEQVFYFVFLSQFAVLQRAKSEGLSHPYFAGARGKLGISDSMIY